tara:strand:- start:333 stop:683 length:351 start_codon:yes stop_codon:yes gene_type:complete
MKKFIFIFLTLILKSSLGSLEINGFSDVEICMFANDPPLPAQVTFEIKARGIECNDGKIIKASETLISIDSIRIQKLKRWNKIISGKGPIYSTRFGADLKINSLGNEKSITINKSF